MRNILVALVMLFGASAASADTLPPGLHPVIQDLIAEFHLCKEGTTFDTVELSRMPNPAAVLVVVSKGGKVVCSFRGPLQDLSLRLASQAA